MPIEGDRSYLIRKSQEQIVIDPLEKEEDCGLLRQNSHEPIEIK